MSNEQANSVQEQRPWMQGPWEWSEGGALRGIDDADDRVLIARHRSWSSGPSAELIALAPELAEAVLEQYRRYPDCDLVRDLAPLLLAIGSEA